MTESSRFTTSQPAAELAGARKAYGAARALDGVDLALRPGEITALLGPNGAGKTTAVRCLLGLTALDAGRAQLFGGDPRQRARRMRTGVMMQIASVPQTLEVREHIASFQSYYPRPLALDEVVAAAGLTGLEDRLYGKLSGGEQQRLHFALALCGDPDLLFLDEPTVGLDVASRRGFWEHIRGRASAGRTVLLTTHYLEEADALADRVVVINEGRIVADGTPAAIKAQAATRHVRCRSRLTAAEVARLTGVERVIEEEGTLDILTAAAESVVRELLRRDAELVELEVVGARLEEAFLSLTGGAPTSTVHKGAA